MARTNHVVLSDDEIERLEHVREEIYNSDSVPMGEVVQWLLEETGY